MTKKRRYASATDLPEELLSIGSLNAYEHGDEHVRIALRLSDPNYEVGQLALLRVSMLTLEVSREYVADSFFMGFHSFGNRRDILVEIGGAVRLRTDGGINIAQIGGNFLRDAWSLDGRIDFVFGDGGDIFRSVDGGRWARDTTGTEQNILAMHGLSEKDLIAVGGNGTVLRRIEGEWATVDVGLGTDLRCAMQTSEGTYIGGDRGFAGLLIDDELRLFDTRLTSDILSVTTFHDKVYFADSDYGLHRLEGARFEPVAELGYVYRINGGPAFLTADAGEYVFQFDGRSWRGVEFTYRGGYRAERFDMSFLE